MAGQSVLDAGLWDVLLNKVTSNTTTAAYNLRSVQKVFTLQTTVTGGPTSLSVKLQGSLDGTTWTDLCTSTSTTGDAQFAVDKPFSLVRASLTGLTGGASPTVTAWFACD